MLIARISFRTAGGSSASVLSSCVLLTTCASSSNVCAICCCCEEGITGLAFVMFVNASERVASRIPPATARPNDRPKDPDAEFTPAASLIRSSSIGASV